MKIPVNEIKPFQALHYDPASVGGIGPCLSPPYDVISPAEQDELYRRHERNVVRLILGKIEPGDDDSNNRYTRAKAQLKEWKRDHTLVKAAHPSFFVYEQTFSIGTGAPVTLSGFIGLVRLSGYDEGRVLPHELVLKKPVLDRVALTLTTNTQFEYIWGLYRDPAREVDGLLAAGRPENPILDYADPQTGVTHRLFRVTDPDRCRAVAEAMRDKKIYIADGHHRYQTMLNVREELRQKHPSAGPDASWEYIMMFLVNAAHPGLVILPTHRLVYGLPESAGEKLRRELPGHFTVERFPFGAADEKTVRSQWLAALEAQAGPAFGVALERGAGYLLASLKDAAAYKKSLRDKATDEWKMLDVNILNHLVLGKILGFSEEMMSLQSNLEYGKDAQAAVERVRRGEMQAALILKGTPLRSVLAVADAGEKMPRKSTFFYPKPLSGLVFYEMD